MNTTETPETLTLNARQLSISQLNERLCAAPSSIATIRIIECATPDLLAPGFDRECRVLIEGNLGDYCLCGISNAEIEVRGRAGCGLGSSMESGSILQHDDTDDATGAFSRGGLITLLGNAGRRVGAGMCGGEIVVKGSIGSQAAMEMTAGTLLIFGNAGAMLGQDMLGGTIYLRGKAASLAPQLEECRLKEADRLRIGLLLLKSGVQGDARDFRVLKVVGG